MAQRHIDRVNKRRRGRGIATAHRVYHLHAELGRPFRDIAQQLGMSLGGVSKAYARAEDALSAALIGDGERTRAKLAARYERVFEWAADAWLRSRDSDTVAHPEHAEGARRGETPVGANQFGNPRFLEAATRVTEALAKLHGLYVTKPEVAANDNPRPYKQVPDALLHRQLIDAGQEVARDPAAIANAVAQLRTGDREAVQMWRLMADHSVELAAALAAAGVRFPQTRPHDVEFVVQ
jgi:hypothetical protein